MNTLPDPTDRAEPWWRVRMMWLVVGGPALVVAASIATAVIAVKNADPVLDKDFYGIREQSLERLLMADAVPGPA